MAKKFENLSKHNKNINALSSIFGNDLDEDKVEDNEKVTQVTSKTSVIQRNIAKEKPAFVRQTLIFSEEDLDFLRNLVYTRRLEGKVTYTQKEALQEVISFFRIQHKEVKERPDDIKEAEQRRSESIIKGKR